MTIRKFYLVIVISLTTLGYAQPRQSHFEKMKPSQPLFGERITSILKASDGYIWACGIDGVSRFDGFNTKNFAVYDSIFKNKIYGNRILAIHEGKDGRIWIGNNKGLSVYSPELGTFQYIKSNIFNTVRINHITEYNDSLLVTSASNTCYFFNTNTNSFMDEPCPYILRAKALDSDHNVWWGTKDGMLIKNDSVRFKVNGPINDLYFTSIGHLYIATSNGLFIIHKNELEKISPVIQHFYIGRGKNSISHKELSSIACYQGQIWIGSRSGLNQVVIDNNEWPEEIIKHYHQTNNPLSISNNQITKLLTDNEGILWIATYNGLNMLDPSKQWFNAFQYQPNQPESLHDNNIICIEGDQRSNIWISGFNSGVTRYSPHNKTFKHFHKGNSQLHSDHLRQISTLNNGVVFFYNNKGISCYNHQTEQFKLVNIVQDGSTTSAELITHQIFEASDKQIWLGTQDALFKAAFDGNSFIVEHFCDLPDINDLQIAEDDGGRLWLASDKGLFIVFPKNSRRVKHIDTTTNPEFITSNFTDITFDSNNNLWLCSVNGLYTLNNKELLNSVPNEYQFTRYSTSDGLPSNHTVAALPDINGRIWISTWNGITRFDPFGTSGHFTTFDASDGLISQKYTRRAAFKDKSANTLYFGGVNGVNFITPTDITPQLDNQTLNLHHILHDEQALLNKAISVTLADTLIINQRKNLDNWKLIFHFNSLLSYHHQNFKWRYIHADSLWHFSTRPELEFGQIDNGEYLIEIMPILPNGESGKAKTILLKVNILNYKLIFSILLITLIAIAWLVVKYIKAKNKKPKYRYSNLSQDESSLIFYNLEQYMQNEKAYLNPKLAVEELTKHLNVSNVTFSQVLNKFKNTSFYEYVNHYRVLEFKQRLAEGYNPNLTLLGLAEECGFSSKSSFYRAFKKETNMTPAQYEKLIQENTTK